MAGARSDSIGMSSRLSNPGTAWRKINMTGFARFSNVMNSAIQGPSIVVSEFLPAH